MIFTAMDLIDHADIAKRLRNEFYAKGEKEKSAYWGRVRLQLLEDSRRALIREAKLERHIRTFWSEHHRKKRVRECSNG